MLVFAFQYAKGEAQREAQIGSRVTVRDWKHIDSVEFILFFDDPVKARFQSQRQTVAGQMVLIDSIQVCSIPLARRNAYRGNRE